MTTLNGVYKAVCLEVTEDRVRCHVPQLFANEVVTCFDVAGTKPVAGAEGFVSFESGYPERPVWMGGQWESLIEGETALSGVWTYDTPTEMADPGSGKVRTTATNTEMALSHVRRDGTDVSNVLTLLVPGDILAFQHKADDDNWGRFSLNAPVVDNGGWHSMALDPLESHGDPIPKNAEVILRFTHSTGGGGGVGPSGPISYVHNQGTSAAVWTITHNLGWYPNVTVIDSGGSTVEGDTTHLSGNQLRLNFSGAFSGVAYLS